MGGFKCHWQERGSNVFPTPSLMLGLGWSSPRAGQGMEWTAQRGAGAATQDTKAAALCPTPWLGIWRISLNSGQTAPINSFPVGPANPFFLFSDLILGEDSRQSLKYRSQTSLSSETDEWPHSSLEETSEQQHHLQPHRPQTRIRAAPLPLP